MNANKKEGMRRKPKSKTPGQRHQLRWKLETHGGEKKVPLGLRRGKRQKSGRNNRGRITVRHRGGGKKRLLRAVYPKTTAGRRRRRGEGEVKGIQYDPNRTAPLALVEWKGPTKAEYTYVLAAEGVVLGSKLRVGERGSTARSAPVGSTRKLKEIPVGSPVFNVELDPGKGGKYVRSAGTAGVLLRKPEGKALIRLPSGARIEVNVECMATLGRVAGEEHRMESVGKAGRKRNKGWRPTVRGEAMNPVDHPHGGRTRGGRPEVTPWGRLAKGKPTRNRKKVSRWRVVRGT
jgi:large subunit ribosomal protein L2